MPPSDLSPILTPEQIAELLVTPVTAAAVATLTSTVVTTASRTWRMPKITADPSAAWVREGEEIAVSQAQLDEVEVVPQKLAGLTVISRELADDTSPEAAEVVGDGLARDIARKLDHAYLQTVAAPAPGGLTSITPTGIAAPQPGIRDLDVFAQATSEAEQLGAELSAWIASPTTALALASLKDEDGSRRPLLGTDPANPTRRTIEGLPVYVSPSCSDSKVWGVPASRVYTVIREDVRIDRDESAFFTSDRVAVRATMRVAWAFPHEAAVVEIAVG